ncbi:hypothetical protein [Thiocapsa marina]|uniref:hypothetical protein n=1 Tax=Thiocapsa marina TaxID=244573 RepID=UPI0011121C5F|nr:hypothetical protein [Thiocapsa marina]
MKTKQILFSSAAALAIMLAGTAAAEQPATPFVSGDEPMNVGQEAQIKAPTPDAMAQEKTSEMLKKESEELTGEYPTDQGAEGQVKDPTPNAAEQAVTAEDLKKEDASGAISGKYE